MGHIAKWRLISKEEFEKLLKESRSWAELAGKLGYSKQGGGTITSLKNAVKEYGLSTEHFLGQAWNKENYDYSSFENGSYKKNGKSTLAPLIKLRGRKCENCGIEEWLGQPINLEIHHIDGNHYNNDLSNLQLLCPNCHSYTDNYCKSTAKKKSEYISDEDFAHALQNNKNIRQALKELGLTAAGDNYSRAREIIQKYNITHLM